MQPQFVNEGPNAIKMLISGSYKKVGDGEIIDFEDVEVIMPRTGYELAVAAARKRFAYSAIKAAVNNDGSKKYDKPIDHIRNVYVDGYQEIEHEFAYVGKGIKQMDEHDLQNLAIAVGLREIPLTRRQSGLSIREMRERTYVLFAERVLGWKIDMNDPAQNDYAKWKDVIPNPMQRAAPVKQLSAEALFSGDQSGEVEKDLPPHMSPAEPPVPTAPHVAPKQPEQPVVEPEIVETEEIASFQVEDELPAPITEGVAPEHAEGFSSDGENELEKLQKLADNNGVEYEWDATVEGLRLALSEKGVEF